MGAILISGLLSGKEGLSPCDTSLLFDINCVMRFLTSLVFSLSILIVSSFSGALANEALPMTGRDTGLSLPRYASIKSNEVFVRAGPGQRYPIKFIYQREGLPIQVTKEFDGWRKVIDARGNEGWVHNTLISGRKTALVAIDQAPLKRKPKENSLLSAKLSKDVIVELDECVEGYCEAETGSFKGFIAQNALWGIESVDSQ